ncbi:MAG TPA: hypothetical protein VK421_06715 [Pyrinomonadaceae bacterium]|nr:hypothetical protein [Pyrinomonadaceae bacterium]
MKKTVTTLMLALALAATAAAQGADGGARAALAALPDSQAVLYVNARRITNDALPRVMPVAQLDKFFGELRKNVNVDLRSVEYVVLAARYDVNSFDATNVPDFGVAVRGGFNADALLSALRIAQPAQHRAETHGDKRIDLYTVQFESPKADTAADAAPAPDAAKPQPMKLPTEFAIVSLGPDELLAGTPAYVRAAIDARGGGQRVRADLVDLALQNPDSLVSLTGDLPPNLSKLFDAAAGAAGQSGAAAGMMNEEIRRLADSLRQLRLSLTMTPGQFGVQATLRTERPEDARALSGLVDFGVAAVEQGVRKELASAKTVKARADAQKVLSLIKSLGNTASDRDLTLSLNVAQATVADFVKQMSAPKPKQAAPPRRARARTTARRRS